MHTTRRSVPTIQIPKSISSLSSSPASYLARSRTGAPDCSLMGSLIGEGALTLIGRLVSIELAGARIHQPIQR